MSIVLVTGGNKGLGYDTARKLINLVYKSISAAEMKQEAVKRPWN